MYRALKLLFLYFLILTDLTARAQDSVMTQNKVRSSKAYKLRSASEALSKSLSDADDLKAAQQYEKLAQEYINQGDNAHAEEQLKKAKEIYTRLKKTEALAVVSRRLAQAQEAQQKIAPAIANYQSAAGNAQDNSFSRANSNDVKRLQVNDPGVQQELVQSNIDILEKSGRKEEVGGVYRQMAETQLQQKDTRGAAESFRKAIAATGDAGDAVKLQKKITDAYIADNQLDKAIALSETGLARAKAQGDSEQQIDQLRELALLYSRQNNTVRTEALLLEAYRLALQLGYTLKAKDCLMALIGYYEGRKDYSRSLALSKTFLGQLDTLIRTDSSLVDNKLYEVTEGRIRELEKERRLQLELLSRKNRFNYFLIGATAAMLVLLFLVLRSWLAIRRKNKKIALQSLRREMNPHFIFNSLNSVNQYIAENNELEANKYLTSYSGLMRNVMEHSNKDFVTLSAETEQLRKYLELEHMRFRDQFDYSITLDDTLDSDATLIPNMLIQPHLENAIWHGLRYKDGTGHLSLRFSKEERHLKVTIEDDGIGLERSRELKTRNQKAHQSRGLTNTAERISLLNDLYKTGITMSISPRSTAGGTQVILILPLMMKR